MQTVSALSNFPMSDFAALLNIHPGHVSKRIFFGKGSRLDLVWHVFDAAFRFEDGTTVALHDSPVFSDGKIVGTRNVRMAPQYTADTLAELEIKRGVGDYVCDTCFTELQLAQKEIRRDDLLKFQ
jgi:folate-dependent phosphoribosylglycinamide formyltransferase PurN